MIVHIATSKVNIWVIIAGKTETFSTTVTDKFLQLQPIMQNITKNLHDLSKNSSQLEVETVKSVDKLEKMITSMDLLHKQATVEMKNDWSEKQRLNEEKCKFITDNLEKKVIENLEKMDNKDSKLKIETEESISNLNKGMEVLSRKVDEDRVNINDLRSFQSDVRSNLDLIKDEINRSVDVLTSAMEKNVTESIEDVEREIRRLEDRSTSMSSNLVKVTGNIDSLTQQSDKVLTELNKLKSHTQRSVDTSAGLRSNMLRVEGKMNVM